MYLIWSSIPVCGQIASFNTGIIFAKAKAISTAGPRETFVTTGTTRGRKAIVEAPLDGAGYAPPLTVSHPALLDGDGDASFRQTLYLMVTTFGRLLACRDAFGRSVDLTGSQFAVLIGAAYTQGENGVTVRDLAAHVQLAATHVTTEVGRLCNLGLLEKHANEKDRRSVLVRLTAKGRRTLDGLSPFVRGINDLLFAGIDRARFRELESFLTLFHANSERALTEIKRRESRRKDKA